MAAHGAGSDLTGATVELQLEMRDLRPLDEREAKIAARRSEEPKHFDELCRESGLAASEVGSTLTLLELKGLARGVGGTSYVAGR